MGRLHHSVAMMEGELPSFIGTVVTFGTKLVKFCLNGLCRTASLYFFNFLHANVWPVAFLQSQLSKLSVIILIKLQKLNSR